MANKMLSNINDLTSAVGKLQQKIDALYSSLNKVSTKATEALGGAQSVLQSGGDTGVGQGSFTMNLGVSGAKFATPEPTGGNVMKGSLSSFSFNWQFKQAPTEMQMITEALDTADGSEGGGGGGGGGGGTIGDFFTGDFSQTARKFLIGGIAGAKFGLAPFAGAYAMAPDISLLGQRSIGLEQALRIGTGNRQMLDQQLTGGLRNAMSSVGADAAVAPLLASRGFMPDTANFKMMVGETAGAFRYLGIDNAAAAQALANLRSPQTGAALYNLGINTYDAATGKFKDSNQIASELMNVLTGGRGATAEQIAIGLQSGTLSSALNDLFQGPERDIMMAHFQQLAQGKNPTLQQLGESNPIPILTGVGQANYAQTRTMQAVEAPMIQGFNKAAVAVDLFNAALDDVLGPLAELKGTIQGIGGTNVGEGLVTALPLIASGIGDIVSSLGGSPDEIAALFAGVASGFGAATAAASAFVAVTSLIPTPTVPGVPGVPKPSGGGSSGYGASFNAKRLGGRGGGYASPEGLVTAMFGDKDSGLWSSSGGMHTGTDFAMPIGSPVTAAMDGVVSSIDAGSEYGTSIILTHPDGYQTVYGHLSERLVKLGDKVSKGQRIARSGDSGNSTGPHLHYEVRAGLNNPIDPSSVSSPYTTFTGTMVSPALIASLTDYSSSSTSGNYKGILGTGSERGWAKSLLEKLGAPASKANVKALNTWMRFEGGHWNNSAHYNPLNTTLDMGNNESMNSVGVKRYNSWEEGLNATVKTLLGNRSSERGYAAIVDALRANAGTSAVLGAVNQSAWVHGEGKASNYNFPRGGGSSAKTITGADAKTVNITVTFNQADEASAMKFARQVQSYLDRENNNSMIGSN